MKMCVWEGLLDFMHVFPVSAFSETLAYADGISHCIGHNREAADIYTGYGRHYQ